MQRKALVYDIGGTKIECAVITASGEFVDSKKIRTPIESWSEGKKAIVEIGQSFLARYPTIQTCGLSAAGPLHAESGMLLHPTNMNWGRVHVTKEISDALGIDVALENDAASAVIAEHWLGHKANTSDLITLTLGTGLGVGVMLNHRLLGGGHEGTHPEIGHQVLDASDKAALCGCGNTGCAEAYLAGSHFVKRARLLLDNPALTVSMIIEKAKAGDAQTLELFDNYSWKMAQFITNLVVTFIPAQLYLRGVSPRLLNFIFPRPRPTFVSSSNAG